MGGEIWREGRLISKPRWLEMTDGAGDERQNREIMSDEAERQNRTYGWFGWTG